MQALPRFALVPLALALSLALPLSPSAHAQGEIVWSDHYQPTTDRSYHRDLVPHPHGGAVAWMGGDSFASPVRFDEIRRLNENGDRVWSVTRPVGTDPNTFTYSFTAGVFASPTGDVVVLSDVGDLGEVAAYDLQGNLRWSTSIPSVVAGSSFDSQYAGFSANGDVYVVGFQLDDTLNFAVERVSVLLLDRASGQPLWRRDILGNYWPLVSFSQGDAFVVNLDANVGWRIERFDDTGAIVSTSDDLFAPGQGWLPRAIASDDQGRVALALSRTSPTMHGAMLVDAAGSVAWIRQIQSPAFLDQAAFTTTGDIVVAPNGTIGRIWRLDALGNVVWTHAAQAGLGGYNEIAATDDDGVAGVLGGNPGSTGASGALERIDAAGNTVSITPLESISPRDEFPTEIAVDRRGNAVVGITLSGSLFDGARTVKVVEGGNPGVPYCFPTVANSTGGLSGLSVTGPATVVDDNVTLLARRLPPNAALFALVSLDAGSTPGAGGSQGTLCLSGSIGRYVGPGQIRRANAAGRATLQLELSEIPTPNGPRQVLAGETWRFQAWHRDANPGPTSNFTNGIEITFQ